MKGFCEVVEHSAEVFGEGESVFGLGACEEVCLFGDEELGLDFGGGACGDEEEASEVGGGVARVAFGDVGGDGDGGAAELVAEGVAFFRGEFFGEVVDGHDEAHGEFPDFEVAV